MHSGGNTVGADSPNTPPPPTHVCCRCRGWHNDAGCRLPLVLWCRWGRCNGDNAWLHLPVPPSAILMPFVMLHTCLAVVWTNFGQHSQSSHFVVSCTLPGPATRWSACLPSRPACSAPHNPRAFSHAAFLLLFPCPCWLPATFCSEGSWPGAPLRALQQTDLAARL